MEHGEWSKENGKELQELEELEKGFEGFEGIQNGYMVGKCLMWFRPEKTG